MHSEIEFNVLSNGDTSRDTTLELPNAPTCIECNSNNFMLCSNQSLRNLRLKRGCSQFGNKNIVECSGCQSCYSSEDMVKIRLDKMFNIGMKPKTSTLLYDSLWSKTQQRSKYEVMMQLYLLKTYINEIKSGSVAEFGSVEYNQNSAITTILRNLHCENHCSLCFKKTVSAK